MKRITLLLIALLSIMSINAADPDFAHPKTTLEAAIKHYDAAISSPSTSTSGVTMIKSLLEIIGATSAIDPDSIVTVIPRINCAIDAYSGADKALMLTIKADLLNSIYSARRWTYDRMETPDEPLPADITEWNGRQFSAQIRAAITDAFTLAAASPDARLANYKSVITTDRTSLMYFPTVASFIALKATSYNFDDQSFNDEIIRRILAITPEKSASWFYWMMRTDGITEFWSSRQELFEEDYSALSTEAFSTLDRLYLANRDCEEAGIVLARIVGNYRYNNAPEWLVSALRDFIARYPAYWQINDLKNALASLTLARVQINVEGISAASRPVKIKVSQYYNGDCDINIYRLTETEFQRRNLPDIKLRSKAPLQTLSIRQTAPEGRSDTVVTADLRTPGYYVAVPMIDGTMKDSQKAYFMLSDYLPVLVENVSPSALLIANLTDGKPVKGITATQICDKKDITTRRLGKSDSKGIIKFSHPETTEKNSWTNYEYSFSDGQTNLKFNNLRSFVSWRQPSQKKHYSPTIFLERELYHQGDTVNWAAIVIESDINNRNHQAAEGVSFTAEFKDSNNQLIDSLSLITDGLGRIYGSFVTPETGLTGNYKLYISYLGYPIAARDVMVSDFKMPTFKIDDLSVSRDTPAPGEVTLRGRAVTYSGMPVAAAKVEAEIWEAYLWRWFSPLRKLDMLQTVTDPDGKFTIVVPDSVLSQSSTKCFSAKFVVTSAAGEAQRSTKRFTTGKPYRISYDGTELIDTDKPVTDLFEVYNADGKTVDIELRWWLTPVDGQPALSDAIASGVCRSTKGSAIDLSTISSGNFNLSVEPLDSTLADAVSKIAELGLFSIKKNTMPTDEPFLLIDHDYTTGSDGSVEILIGAPVDNSYYYLVSGNEENLVAIDTLHFDSGFHRYRVTLDNNRKYLTLWLVAIREAQVTTERINIRRPDERKLTLEGSSMRDRLDPGSEERWTLRLSDWQDKGVGAGLIATMFNAALNAISPYEQVSRLYYQHLTSPINIFSPSNYGQSAMASRKFTLLKQAALSLPEFDPAITYRALNGAIRIRGAAPAIDGLSGQVAGLEVVMEKSMATADLALSAIPEPEEDNGYDEEEYEVVSEPVKDAKIYGYRSPQAPDAEQQFSYRDSEVLQAFWKPDLTFDQNGEAIISFTVPNANTTWAFNAFAWTADARSAKMVREFVASKPVMVQPNLPRFLRAGDRAEVLATVFNNSDSAAVVTTVVEIFDIATGGVTAQFSSTDSIAAGESAIVRSSVAAEGDVAAIGYRVRSTLGRFTDGEQTFIPVLAATSDVIESENFYLNPGDREAEIKIPNGKKMQSTLDYTANPAWNIIKELPGLAAENSSTSVGAARQLFGSATAEGLLRSYPELAEVLKAWSDDPDSKALTSRLAQNDALKAAVLNSTPWVQAAASDTERMARLSLLFDRKATQKSIAASIATLKKLQQPDGGWSWGEWGNRSSVWATNIALQELGRLNDIGYLPADKELRDMISRAIAYYISQIPQKAKTDYSLAYITTLFPDVEIDLRGRQIVNATIQYFVANWKSEPTWHKAIEAAILDRNGHKAVAREIIGSLSQFAVTSADKGTSFPSVTNVNDYTDLLYAFGRLAPDSKLINGMRQWLVLRQQTTEQLGSLDPTRLIAAFTSTGSDWFGVKTGDTSFTLGGAPLSVGNTELATGHIVYNLPANSAGMTLSIDRGDSASVPAYGSVISRYTAASTSVKAKSCSDLSVEKRITALRDGRWQYVDYLRLGEQVRVVLTIKAKRDLEYVTVIDERPAAFEPVDQLPGWVWNGGAGFYRENRDAATNLFIDYLPKGTYQITVEMTATVAGDFTSGIATVQSQLAPSITAHSAGSTLHCE